MIDMRGPYMIAEDWKRVRHFTPDEAWGDRRRVHRNLVFLLDAFRAFIGRPVVIHNAYAQNGHTDESYHYRGMAVDLHVEGLSVFDQFIEATRFEFGGIGVYPFWNNPGLHLDIRPRSGAFAPEARWMRTKAGVYVPLTWQNLKEAA